MQALKLATAVLALAPVWAQTTVTISPTAPQVHLGTYQPFTAKVTGNTNTSVSWSVALPSGATGSAGTISTGGNYTPPSALPSVNTVTVTATSVATPTFSASAAVTLLNPFPTVASTIPSSVAVGAFTLTINGTGFVNGAQALFGGAPLQTTYVSPTRLTATGTAAASQKGQQIAIGVTNPNPGSATSTDVVTVLVGPAGCASSVVSANVAGRFLEQAAFGPDAATLAHVQCVGLSAYIAEQLSAPISPYQDPATLSTSISPVQARFFSNAVQGPDQLRQRMAFALAQLFVVSAVEESSPAQLVPYLQILQNDAFGNFRPLMEDVTLSPTMGEYLDMRNNDKANPVAGTRANENYARELMQLFTIGLFQLNQDGSLALNAGQPVPTYDQTTIQNFARIYTGWTYPTKPAAVLQKHNPAYYIGPMVPYESNHDNALPSKTLLNGLVVPAGGTAESDLKAALDNIFNHANVGPFVCKQLIQHLVMSNPSTSYISRAAGVFNDNGHGVRGDLGAVVKAILLDPEARIDDNGQASLSDNGGHLREPVFLIAAILRGLGASVNDSNNLTAQATNLGQTLFAPPTVFNYYAPGYLVPPEFTPGQSLSGPEFQLDSPSAAVGRYNLVNSMVYGNLGGGAVIDWTPFSSLGNNPAALATLVNNTFFYGLMPGEIQTEMMHAMNAITGTTASAALQRAQAAVYVAVSSSYYTVEH